MTDRPTWHAELLQWCGAARDGTLLPGDRVRLEALLGQSAEARQFYVRFFQLHACLEREVEGRRCARMRLLVAFIVGCAIGMVVTALVNQAFVTPSPNLREKKASRMMNTKYVGRIIDEIHFALMLRATCPELVPDWLEWQIVDYVNELHGELRTNVLSRDALQMIEAYYIKNELAIPPEFDAIFAERREEAETKGVKTIKERLSAFDEYMAARKKDDSAKRFPIVEIDPENGS